MDEYTDLLPQARRGQPAFIALVIAVLRQVLDLRDLTEQLQTAFYLPEAEGEQLDMTGSICGCRRNTGETDAAYRARIVAAAMRNAWNGTNEGLRDLLAVYAPSATFRDNQDLTVTVTGTTLAPVPAGVRLITQ
ncbi:MAG: hypothetical protein Q4G19_02785 [Clostridia bacterium]|nr:hypothetical protein [Clostridia bacterium]